MQKMLVKVIWIILLAEAHGGLSSKNLPSNMEHSSGAIEGTSRIVTSVTGLTGMVIIVIWIMLLVEVYGGLMKKHPMQYPWKVEKNGVELMQPSKKQEMHVISQFQQVNLNNIDHYDMKEALISIKTLRHRNKRYASYGNIEKQSSKGISSSHHRINRLRHRSDIALCPFKVCYMGRKRMRSRRLSRKIAVG